MGHGAGSSRSPGPRQPRPGSHHTSPPLPMALSLGPRPGRPERVPFYAAGLGHCAGSRRSPGPRQSRSGVYRTSPPLPTALSLGPRPGPGRPERGRRSVFSTDHPVRVCDDAGFR
ncbi:hypothetical protein NDU88_004246 [Pleurodeles waltl]|uniref:Uncharacterized protein n=1 Tax=Pleurodeles waltl TaxID=8319 RepID=A0AAV7MXY0_PLEWA|nr:hypothetical protein NDU88_004246 [Pleurodeles waltl]